MNFSMLSSRLRESIVAPSRVAFLVSFSSDSQAQFDIADAADAAAKLWGMEF